MTGVAIADRKRNRFGELVITDEERPGRWVVYGSRRQIVARFDDAMTLYGTSRMESWEDVAREGAERSYFDREDPLDVYGLRSGASVYVIVRAPTGEEITFTIHIGYLPHYRAYRGIR